MTRPLRQPQVIDDERLGRSVTVDDSEAFSVLYERYHGLLFRYCRSILRSDADAHDAVQSTFTRALEALQRDQRDAPLRPWLFRIAHNEAISALRRRRASDRLAAPIEGGEVSAEDHSRAREEFRSLVADLRQLPDRPRGAILMHELVGLSYEEIAAVMGTNRSGVRGAIFEARRAMTEFARGRHMDCEEVRRVIAEGDRRVLRGRRIHAHLRDCAECARFAAAWSRRSGRLSALTPAGWGLAAGKLLPHRLWPGWSGAQGPVFATALVSRVTDKLTAVLATKAAVLAAGLITAGSATVGLSHDGSRTTSQAATPNSPGATIPGRFNVGRQIGGGSEGSVARPRSPTSPSTKLTLTRSNSTSSREPGNAQREATSRPEVGLGGRAPDAGAGSRPGARLHRAGESPSQGRNSAASQAAADQERAGHGGAGVRGGGMTSGPGGSHSSSTDGGRRAGTAGNGNRAGTVSGTGRGSGMGGATGKDGGSTNAARRSTLADGNSPVVLPPTGTSDLPPVGARLPAHGPAMSPDVPAG
jgi:RNA polymerase sigma factor (sigma-70 family)